MTRFSLHVRSAPSSLPPSRATAAPRVGAWLVALGLLVGCGGTAVVEQGGAGGGTGEPVPCGEGTCSAGQLCLWPPDYCDYSSQPPQVVREPKACASIPAACAGQSGSGLLSCLEEELCTGVVTSGLSTYEGGLLTCGPGWYDCF